MSSRAVVAAAAGVGTGWALRHVTSPAVRGWSRPRVGDLRRAGSLAVRDSGTGDETVVLLHGLTGSNLVWGGAYDALAEHRRLVAPDLLGFGGSIDASGAGYDLAAHLDALDAAAARLGLDGGPLVVVGWSLGALLALHWAARREETVRVVAFCAPLYRSAEEADERIRDMGLLERLFALDSPLARFTCRMMCRYREQAQWLSVAISPQWPVPIARSGVRHTWSSYLGAMNDVIRQPSWPAALTALDGRGVPVLLAEGARDPVPVPGLAAALAAEHRRVTTTSHPSAGHDLPVAYPNWCRTRIR